MIPRTIHRIWLGPDPMPDEFVRYGETWRKHHPGWEHRLWTDADLPQFSPEVQDQAVAVNERSNILRYEIVYRHGGVYVDTDVECLRSIDPLLKDVDAFATSWKPGRISGAIIGGEPQHPAFARAIEELVRRGGGWRKGSTADRRDIFAGEPGVTVFACPEFSHSPDQDRSQAYAVHHLSGSWKTPRERDLRRKLEESRATGRALREQLRVVERSYWWRIGMVLRLVPRGARRKP
jgi:hypothetical protein